MRSFRGPGLEFGEPSSGSGARRFAEILLDLREEFLAASRGVLQVAIGNLPDPLLMLGDGLLGLLAVERELAQHFRGAGNLRREPLFEFARQLFDRVVARGFQHGLQALGHPRHGRFRAAVHLAALRFEHGFATPRPLFRRRLKESREFAAPRFQLRDGFLKLRNHRFALGRFLADRGAQRPQHALRLRGDLRMRVAQDVDSLL